MLYYERFAMAINDMNTTLSQLRAMVKQFNVERDWQQFHSHKEMAINLSIEANELLELFLWHTPEQVDQMLITNPKLRVRIEEELADVIHTALAFAEHIPGLDVTKAFVAKLDKTARKYPVDQVKGIANKKFE
jgi:NTP pyrophosphatase (non-canonical NTP hydrolase)